MNKSSSGDSESLSQAIETLRIYCGLLLLNLEKYKKGLDDNIIGDFIARGMTCTDSIFVVWQQGREQDAWILHRSLVDRLFLLHYLIESNSFAAFEEYSFMKTYETRRGLLNDKEMLNKFSADQIKGLKELLKSQEACYLQLKSKPNQWCRPKAKEVAKNMGLGFLYRFGYDYASMYVHPMALDGEVDFIRLVSSSNNRSHTDSTVIKNSILVQSILIQEGINASSMKWRAIIYDFLDQILKFLGDANNLEFNATLYKIGRIWPDNDLCKSRDSSILK